MQKQNFSLEDALLTASSLLKCVSTIEKTVTFSFWYLLSEKMSIKKIQGETDERQFIVEMHLHLPNTVSDIENRCGQKLRNKCPKQKAPPEQQVLMQNLPSIASTCERK